MRNKHLKSYLEGSMGYNVKKKKKSHIPSRHQRQAIYIYQYRLISVNMHYSLIIAEGFQGAPSLRAPLQSRRTSAVYNEGVFCCFFLSF